MNIVILTGAGISAESGVPTFRGLDGLWEGHRIEDVATPEAFIRNPALVLGFYNLRRSRLRGEGVEPNPAHYALARLAREHKKGRVLVITQNIDDLHERAGLSDVLHMHGELMKSRCVRCGAVSPCAGDLLHGALCRACHHTRTLRPHVVWFGEMPFHLEEISAALSTAHLFVAIGTSGHVYPAAGFVRWASDAGARTLEINLDESASSEWFHESRRGPAGELVPGWVEEVLGSGKGP
jgi:NAD-dependent deacetylase